MSQFIILLRCYNNFHLILIASPYGKRPVEHPAVIPPGDQPLMLGLIKELPFPEHRRARGPWFSTFRGSGEAPGHSLLAPKEQLGGTICSTEAQGG